MQFFVDSSADKAAESAWEYAQMQGQLAVRDAEVQWTADLADQDAIHAALQEAANRLRVMKDVEQTASAELLASYLIPERLRFWQTEGVVESRGYLNPV